MESLPSGETRPHPALRATFPRDAGEGLVGGRMIRGGESVKQRVELSTGDLRPVVKIRPAWLLEPYSWYVEERWVSEALFDEEEFGPCIVDPCAGLGNIVASARKSGLLAYGSDVIARARQISGGRDFLSERWRFPHPRPLSRVRDLRVASPGGEGGFAIVGNPPWGGRLNLLRAFAEAACERPEKVALLAPAHRLAAAGSWLTQLPLKRVLHITPRPAMWPGPIYLQKMAAGEPLKNGFQDFVWLVFDRGFRGKARVGWLRPGTIGRPA
jgi:hypothetical protein